MEETIRCRGHEHVTAEHGSTFEVTTDDWLTPAGDCILGVEADRAPADFDPEFVAACRDEDATIVATFETAAHRERVEGRGHPDLTFDSDRSLVGRTSTYVDDRTVMVDADEAAADFDRDLVEALAGDTPTSGGSRGSSGEGSRDSPGEGSESGGVEMTVTLRVEN